MKRSEDEETEAAGETGAGVEVIRVRVSLERYFSDERARCYMSVSRARPVRSLARRLRRAFRLPRPFALLSRGHLLPPDEPLTLLRADDPVQVVPTKTGEPVVSETGSGDASLVVGAARSPAGAASPAVGASFSPRSSAGAMSPAVGASLSPRSPAGDEADGAAAAEAEPDEPRLLEHMKRRALELLEECEPAPAARRRRRVRRRRRAPSAAPEPAVLRNGAAGPRAARLVRPLPAAPPADGGAA